MKTDSKNFQNIKANSLPRSMSEVTGELTLEFVKECRKDAIKELQKRSNISGFRPGNVPEEILIKQIGETHILEEAAEIGIAKVFDEIMKEAKVSAIGRPTVAITKLAPEIPLEFKITTAVNPDFELPDYKKISLEARNEIDKEKLEVTDKEVEDVKNELIARNIKPEIPEGENLEDKIKENILKEKEVRQKEKLRLSIINKLIKETKIDVPEILIQSELERMLNEFKSDVERAGLKWSDYLKSINKTEEAVRDDWTDKALDRAKAELIVGKIAEAEKIEPTKEELDHEATHLLEHYPDADPFRVRIYIYTQIRNQKVFEYLENLK